MDAAPLIKAHDHAKSASLATETTVAVNQHSLAAGEFATASSQTESFEALRTLKLLEKHHKRLAVLLQTPAEAPASLPSSPDKPSPSSPSSSSTGSDGKLPASNDVSNDASNDASNDTSTPKHHAQPAPSFHSHRQSVPTREVSSSIANNLASARGIRTKKGQTLSPTVSKDQAPGNLGKNDANPRRDGSKPKSSDRSGMPSWAPPSSSSSTSTFHESASGMVVVGRSKAKGAGEDGYSRFTAAFGNLVSALSAPLAYAGLPLIPGEPDPELPASASDPANPRRKRAKPAASAAASTYAEPDLKKIYSKAALRALGRNGSLASDSYCVVPKTGHTMSYANILNFAEKEKRRQGASRVYGDMSDIAEDVEEEDFVDARETQIPPSPALRKRVGKTQGDRDLRNAIEELYTENQNLKEMLDKVTNRLHAFEASAQTSSVRLAESIRLMRPTSPASSGGGQSEADTARRRELERQLVEALKRVEDVERENSKQDKALAKYREKWEKLKAGAKARREAQNSIGAIPEPGTPN